MSDEQSSSYDQNQPPTTTTLPLHASNDTSLVPSPSTNPSPTTTSTSPPLPAGNTATTQHPLYPTPKNWPQHIRYLSRSLYAPSITPSLLSDLHAPTCDNLHDSHTVHYSQLPPAPNPAVVIQPISSPTHPAHGQHGLFAAKSFRPGELVCLYTGLAYTSSPEVGSGSGSGETSQGKVKWWLLDSYHTERQRKSQWDSGDYDLTLCKESNVSVDAELAGNEGRFVNEEIQGEGYSKGWAKPRKWKVKASPNVEFREIWVTRSKREIGRKIHERVERRRGEVKAKAKAKERGQGSKGAALRTSGSGDVSGKGSEVSDSAVEVETDVFAGAREWDQSHERCMALFVLSKGKSKDVGRYWGIGEGEELLVNYGKGFWKGRAQDGIDDDDG